MEVESVGTYTGAQGRRQDTRRRHARHRPARVPDEVPAHWLVYFAVEDTDADPWRRLKELGGGVMLRPDRHRRRPLRRSLSDPLRRRLRRDQPSRDGSARQAPRVDAEVGGRFRGVAGLALVLPVGGLAEAGALDDLEAEHRALHPRRRDLDPEQVEDELLRQPQQLLARLAGQLVGQQRGRRGRDRAAFAVEGDLGDPARPRRAGSSRAARRRRTGWCPRTRGRDASSRPKLCGRL